MEPQPVRPTRTPILADPPSKEEELWTDEGSDDYTGWFCVATDPFPCPAPGCPFVAEFMTAAHLILVWQKRDDPNLLRHAQRAKEVERNPHVTEYGAPSSGGTTSAQAPAWEYVGMAQRWQRSRTQVERPQ